MQLHPPPINHTKHFGLMAQGRGRDRLCELVLSQHNFSTLLVGELHVHVVV